MTLTQLLYFRELAKIQHLTRTADALHVSQPSLSNAISSLEKELGAKLFVRKGRSITLSEQGAAFYLCVDQVIETLNTGVEKVRESNRLGQSIVRISFISSLALTIMPFLLENLSLEHPDITISLKYEENQQALIDSLLSEKIHLALGFSAEGSPISVPLVKEELVFLMSKNHRLAQAKSLSLYDVQDEPILMSSKDAYMFQHVNNMFSYCGIAPKPYITEDNYMTRSCYTAIGNCIAIASRTDALVPNTVQIPIDHPMNFREIYLSWTPASNSVDEIDIVRQYIIKKSKTIRNYDRL